MTNQETNEEKAQRVRDELIQNEIILGVDVHSERLKSVLIALRMAQIPFETLTASVLHELSMRMGAINENMED